MGRKRMYLLGTILYGMLIIWQTKNTPERSPRRAFRSWRRCFEYFSRGSHIRSLAELWHGLEDGSCNVWWYVSLFRVLFRNLANNL